MSIDDFNIECKKCRSLDCSLDTDDGYIIIKCNQCGNTESL